MKVRKSKRNSMITMRKLQIKDYANNNDKKIIKINLSRVKIPNNKPNLKVNNNLYIKSEFNLHKNDNKQSDSLTYIKSLPSHIVKKQFYITPTKLDNNKNDNNKINKEIKADKNEESLSTFTLTKESMIMTPQKNENINENNEEEKNKQRSLSCAERNLNKNGKNKENMIFVKKKIQGNIKNSFMLNKVDSDILDNNSCCFFGEYQQQQMKYNPNNSMDNGCNNYYNKNYMNIIKNLDNNHTGNNVLITNNNINLITNNNYINNNNIDAPENNIILRNNNSAILRSNKNKKINKIRVFQNVKNNIIEKSPQTKNIINYFNNMNINLVKNNLRPNKYFN